MREIAQNELAEIYRSYLEKTKPNSRRYCPNITEIFSFFLENTPRKRKMEIIDHISHCIYCLEDFLWAQELERELMDFAKKINLLMNTNSINIIKRFSQLFLQCLKTKKKVVAFSAGALMFFIAIIIFLPYIQLPVSNPDIFRGSPHILLKIVSPPPNGILGKEKPNFVWISPYLAHYCIFELYDSSLMLVWKSKKILVDHYKLPIFVLSTLKTGQIYFWSITFVLENGKSIESQLSEFRIYN